MNKYEFAKPIAGRVWVEAIFTDEKSGVPVRFETSGRSDADSGSVTIYRHDPAIRIDPSILMSDGRNRYGGCRRKRRQAIPHAEPSFLLPSSAAGRRPLSLRSKGRLKPPLAA